MATRTFHPLPKRPTFASVPTASSGSQRHSHQQHHGHVSSSSMHTQSPTTRGQSVASATSPPTPAGSVSTPAPATTQPPQPTVQVQQSTFKPIALPPALTESSSLLGSQITLDASFHISCATYSGSTLACERFREHIVSGWKDSHSVLEQYLIDFDQVEGQLTIYRYDDVLCDTEEFDQFGLSLLFSSVHPLSGPLSFDIRTGFLHALRERLIHLMCRVSAQQDGSSPRIVKSSSDSFIFVPRRLHIPDEWTYGWTSVLKRPLLKVSLVLHLVQEPITSIHVLCCPSLSNLHIPSPLFPLEPGQQIRLLPHNVSGHFTSFCTREEYSGAVYTALREEYSRCLGSGWSTVGLEESKLAKVWIPVAPKDQRQSSSKEEFGAECIYPLSHILVESIGSESGIDGIGNTSNYDTNLKLEKRVQEISAFIDSVVKERERVRMSVTHGNPGFSKSERGVDGKEEPAHTMEPDETIRPLTRRRIESQEDFQSLRRSSSVNPDQQQTVKSGRTGSHSTRRISAGNEDTHSLKTKSESEYNLSSFQGQSLGVTLPDSVSSSTSSPALQSQMQAVSHKDSVAWNKFELPLDEHIHSDQTIVESNRGVSIPPNSSVLPHSVTHKRRVSDTEGDSFDFTDDDFRFFDAPGQVNPSGIPIVEMVTRDPPPLDADSNVCIDLNQNFLRNEEDAHGIGSISSDVHGDEDVVKTPMNLDVPPSNNGVSPRIVDGPGIFDPIDFGQSWYLRSAIIADEDNLHLGHEYPLNDLLKSLDAARGWKRRYDQKTNPRYGVLRLLENKRKLGSELQKEPLLDGSLHFESGEAWTSPMEEDTGQSEEELSETESVEAGSPPRDLWQRLPRREKDVNPSANPADVDSLSSFPLGPSFAHSCFSYSSLSKRIQIRQIHPSDSTNSPSGMVQPISAPTPVSPGANCVDRIKSFESAANALAQEIVLHAGFFQPFHREEMPSIDLSVEEFGQIEGLLLLTRLEKLLIKSTLSTTSSSDDTTCSSKILFKSCHRMQIPHLLVGQSQTNDLLEILPSAIHYWDKLGLQPKCGQKDVRLLLVQSTEWRNEAESSQSWLKHVQNVYQERLFGQAVISEAPGLEHGVIYVSWDSFRRSVSTLLDGLYHENAQLVTVILVSIPAIFASINVPQFRQILLYTQKIRTTNPSVLFHLIPDHLPLYVLRYPKSRHRGVEQLACNIYDRILLPVKRSSKYRNPSSSKLGKLQGYFQAPAFTLASPEPSFQVTANFQHSLDVTERHMLLHFAYCLSSCGRWLTATCVDQVGHSSDAKVWALGDGGEDAVYDYIVGHIWNFIIETAKKADVEWRIVIAKVGPMDKLELQAWDSRMSSTFVDDSLNHSIGDMHISVMSLFPQFPWYFAPSSLKKPVDQGKEPTPNRSKESIYQDISSFTYSVETAPGLYSDVFSSPPDRVTQIVDGETALSNAKLAEPLLSTALVRIPYSVFNAPASVSTLLANLLHTVSSSNSCMHKPLPTHMRDIIRNLFELEILAITRWGEDGFHLRLPLHLAALQTIVKSLPSFSEYAPS